jgi:type III secretory pathway component EscU
MKKVENVEKVKHFRTIHTLRSLPDEGKDVCKVWFRNVNLYKVQTNKQTFSFIYKINVHYFSPFVSYFIFLTWICLMGGGILL